MKYHNMLALGLAAALSAGLLAGCGEEVPADPVETVPAASEAPVPETAEPAPSQVPEDSALSLEQQIRTLVSARDIWRMEEEDWGELSWYAYTVCDLDLNGRLEILGTTTQGTGMFTTNYMWEVNEAGDGLEQRSDPEMPTCLGVSNLDMETGEELPYPAYYDGESGTLYVQYIDVVRNGAAEVYESTEALLIADGRLLTRSLAFKIAQYDDEGNETVIYEDGERNPITQEEYENAGALAFPGIEPQALHLEWLTKERTADMSDEELTAALTVLAQGFELN